MTDQPSTDEGAPTAEQGPSFTLGYMIQTVHANAPSGEQVAVILGFGNTASGEAYTSNTYFIPFDQAEGWAEMILTKVRQHVEQVRRAKLGAPSGGLVLPGQPGFGVPPSNGAGPH